MARAWEPCPRPYDTPSPIVLPHHPPLPCMEPLCLVAESVTRLPHTPAHRQHHGPGMPCVLNLIPSVSWAEIRSVALPMKACD